MTTMEKSRSELWNDHWNQTAELEDAFASVGRSSYQWQDMFLHLKDISGYFLSLDHKDIMLDAGGGIGLQALYFATSVAQVDLFDYSENMIKKAREVCRDFDNIHPYVDDLRGLENTKKLKRTYTRCLLGGGILQYLNDYDEVELTFDSVYEVMAPGGVTVITHTPDEEKKEAQIRSYENLDLDKEAYQKAMDEEDRRFWLNRRTLLDLAQKAGFSKQEIAEINPALRQSLHMFDMVLTK